MKTNKEKLKRIEQLLAKSSGVKEVSNPSITGNKTVKTIEFEVNDYEDVTSYIKALLEVCYYTLDGNGQFVSHAHRNSTQADSVLKVLELVLDILPFEEMHCLDLNKLPRGRATEVLEQRELLRV